MDYFAWRRKRKVCLIVFLLLFCDMSLLLLNEVAVYAESYNPVRIQYQLCEIPENQAVMCVKVTSASGIWRMIANKKGRWKIFDASAEYYEEYEEKYGEDWSEGAFCDYILEDERIPWQPERIRINQKALERALNIPIVKFVPVPCKRVYVICSEGSSWYLIDPSPEREGIYYDESAPINGDLTMVYMQDRLEQLEEMGHKVCNLPVPPPSQRDLYW